MPVATEKVALIDNQKKVSQVLLTEPFELFAVYFMRPVIRNSLVFAMGAIFAVSLLVFVFQWPGMPRDALQGVSLVPPTVQAVEASSTTPPLNTSEISLIAYYERASGWTLAETVPAFVGYIDGGNYYDGFVRVWDSGTIGSVSTEPDDTYIDVEVRVRADGWLLAWFNRFKDDSGALVWWGHRRITVGFPPAYSTTLTRAIEVVFTVSGVGFPGYEQIGLYDYSEPDATRLLIFGHSAYGTRTYYYTIPAESTMVPIKLLIRAGGYGNSKLYVDNALIYSRGSSVWGWSTYQIDAWEKAVQHSIEQTGDYYHSVAFVMWTG